MSIEDDRRRWRATWSATVEKAIGPLRPSCVTFTGPDAIARALQPFVRTVNHMYLPSSGGLDLKAVRVGTEPGTLEFVTSERGLRVASPATMTIEYIAADPAESFIVIDLARLEPTDVYVEDEDGEREYNDIDTVPPRREELLEIAPGDYVARGLLDAGYLGHDDNGFEIPLPDDWRLISRQFDGRFMLVTKGSIWNRIPATYDGRHESMTTAQIRNLIERAITTRASEAEDDE